MLYLDWRFLPVYDQIDPTTAHTGAYDVGLVALSIVVATLAAFVALSISGRIVASNSRGARWAWASAVALHVISQRTDPGFKRLAVGGVLMGAAIGLMHYSGMAAMEPEALLRYDPGLVAVSIVVAVGLAFISLGIRFRFHGSVPSRIAATALAAPFMGFAVAGMHYTAMQASIFFPSADAPLGNMTTSPMFLAALITIFVVLIMVVALVATFAGRQVELAQSLAAEIAERKRTEQELIKARQQAELATAPNSQFLAT